MSFELSGWIGTGASYTGDIEFKGRVRIDGRFRGRVVTDDLVEIGREGAVLGRIEAAQVLVAGVVEGDIVASERVTLLESAVVSGSVTTPWVDVRMGAKLRAEFVVERGDE